MSGSWNAETRDKQSSRGSGSRSTASGRSDSGGSKAFSSPDSIDFRFLNFSHPKDAKDAQTRRNVRSHVTSKQHERQRKAAAEQAQRDQQVTLRASSPSLHLPRVNRKSQGESPGPSETETSSPEASSASPYSASSPASISPPARINPMEIYPEEWHASLRLIMDHYLDTMCIDLPAADAGSRERIRTTFLGIVLTDRASLHALMLVAGAHYDKMRPQRLHGLNLLQLRGMAIEEINRAMMDHKPGGRATSDQLIVAVGKMATYELLFGQRETFHTHMTGLQRMISLRGGLSALTEDGLLESNLLWIDSNAADITGLPLYFPPAAFSSTIEHPRPDRRLFLLGVSGTS